MSTVLVVRVAAFALIASLLSVTAGGTKQGIPGSAAKTTENVNSPIKVNEAYGKLPLHFQVNQGQTAAEVKFVSRGTHDTVFLASTEAVLVLTKPEQAKKGEQEARVKAIGTVLRMAFSDARPDLRVSGEEELPGKANYFIGNERQNWHTNVPTYKKVRYHNLYSGIDLVYYGSQQQLEYDFVVEPGADPAAIGLRFQGAETLNVDAQGDLVLDTAVGLIRMQKPFIYQNVDGLRQEISGSYVLKNTSAVGFEIGTYDATRPLVIDPVLFYSTFFGGSGYDFGVSVAVDIASNAYVTGLSASANFPTTSGAFQTTYNGGTFDGFVSKLNPTGSGLVYSTFLGGSGQDQGAAIAIDAADNAYIAGVTDSANFPTTPGAFQTTYGGGPEDGFVAKLNSTGSGLVYSTYVGGSGQDELVAVAVDATGNAYATGITNSSNFPTTPGAFQTSNLGSVYNVPVVKLNPTGSGLIYSTYLGGSAQDQGQAIAVDMTGNAYITGVTTSGDFPTANPFQPANAGSYDAFVTKLNPLGSGLVYSSFLGGSDADAGNSIAVDTIGNAYVDGVTYSTDFPTTLGAFQTTFGGTDDAFVTKINPLGNAFVYSTYLGGSGYDEGRGIAVDGTGNAYITGLTDSTNFPTLNPIQATNAGGFDAFVTKLNPLGNLLVYSTYLGGSGYDPGWAIAVDALPNPNAYVTGTTTSSDFPTTPGAFQTTYGGSNDAFVAKITDVVLPPPLPTVGKVTGGGTIDVAGGIGNFGFIVQARSTAGPIGGNLQYHNHATSSKVQSVTFTSLVIAANTATFSGTCTNNGAPCTFTVNVTDNGEPGKNDTFTISVSGGPPEGGRLRSGNIQIHN